MRPKEIMLALIVTLLATTQTWATSDPQISQSALNPYLEKSDFLVVIFMSSECPLCRNYALTLNQISEQFDPTRVSVLGIFSEGMDTPKSIEEFSKKYKVKFASLIDKRNHLVDLLDANVTPEAYLIDKDGSILYQGKIDNWAVTLGRQRVRATKHYLLQAIEEADQNRPITTKQTKAIGCMIQR
jgi:thiol-disulfide isomerase/thioredoxin